MRRTALLGLVLWLVGAGAAAAHPHIWVDYDTTFLFDEAGRVTAIRERWRFDEMFGTGVVADFDKNKDKAFDAKELAKLKAGAFDNMKDSDFFTHVWADGVKLTLKPPVGFAAEIDGPQLIYTFTLPLPEPVDAARRKLGLIVADQEFFLDIQLSDLDPVQFEGSQACGFTVIEDAEHDVWGTPSRRINLTCPPPS